VSGKKVAATLLITERALRDIVDIEQSSTLRWGKRVATRYIADIEAALIRLQEMPELLRPESEFHPQLLFYRVRKHVLVCDRQPKAIFLLTIIHTSRDIPSRLAELAPTLAAETELLHQQLSRILKN
jgi:plasmid stabilization system protein ParE